MTTNTTSLTKEHFRSFYRKLAGEAGLMDTLVHMQHGVSDRKAYEIADSIIQQVAAFEGTLESLREDTLPVIDSFLAESWRLQGEDREKNLHRIHFGLKLYNDPAMVEDLKEGKTLADLFEAYYTEAQNDPALTGEALTDTIRRQLSSLGVSPKVMTAIARKLESEDSLLLAATSLGADSQRFKCILAMELYEAHKDEGMTTAEAATLACSSQEVQAIADAAGRGMVTQERAIFLMSLVALTILLVGILCHFPFFLHLVTKFSLPAATSLAKSRSDILIIGVLVSLVSDVMGKLAGRVSANYHFNHASEHEAMLKGLHGIADTLKAKAGALKEKAEGLVGGLKDKAASLAGTKAAQPAADADQEDVTDGDMDPILAL